MGWINIGGTWYYLNGSGAMCTGWYQDGKTWYYSNGSGAMQTGWLQLGNTWYYLNGSGAMATGWINVGGTWYYMNPSGAMCTGWYQDGKTWYYSNGSGAMQTGWINLGNTWYYLKGNGAMATGWINLGGTRYYMTGSGAMATGWIKIGKTWYYLGGSGAMHTGFHYIGGHQYYFKADGAMLAGGEYTIGGQKYKINASGVIEGYDSQAMNYAKQKLDQIGWNLRAAFNWSAGIPYYHNDDNVPAGYTHTEWYAKYGFENSRGDCYVMAATFYCMAKQLGYDVHYVEGQVPLARGGMGPHGWCEIVIDGTTYVFDPNFTNETGRNGYQITYGASGTWMYSSYSRVN